MKKERDLFGPAKSRLTPGAQVRAWRKKKAKAQKAVAAQRLARLRAEHKSKFEWDLRDVSEGGDIIIEDKKDER